MSKILRTTIVSAVMLGVAAVSPLSAQARVVSPVLQNTAITMDSCNGGAPATGRAVNHTWSITVPAGVAGATGFDYRARVFTVVNGKQVFQRDRTSAVVTQNANGTVTASGSAPVGSQVYRLDALDPALEAVGAMALLYTSDGAAACD